VERGDADKIILHPEHRYTQHLIGDVPKIHEKWDLTATPA